MERAKLGAGGDFMRYALVNPNWTFTGSVYFGCPEPHLPLELAYAKRALEKAGHEAEIMDAHMFGLSLGELRARLEDFEPDFTVLSTAPTYLFWRCAQPELSVPEKTAAVIAEVAGVLVAVGPHPSSSPGSCLARLRADAVLRGEFEQALPLLAQEDWRGIPGLVFNWRGRLHGKDGRVQMADVARLPALIWSDEWIARHGHHHQRFDAAPLGPGAEVEASRGCPYSCVFCAREHFRSSYRKRPLAVVLAEIDGLLAKGVEYVYFIDELFLPDRVLLSELAARGLKFGIQTRIDLWKPRDLALLGRAGCVSMEAGLECPTPEGRAMLGKRSAMSTEQMVGMLALAKRAIPFVQTRLVDSGYENPEHVARWRERLRERGIWSNDPAPMFPYPGSTIYRRMWGEPDDLAWERALAQYLGSIERSNQVRGARAAPGRRGLVLSS